MDNDKPAVVSEGGAAAATDTGISSANAPTATDNADNTTPATPSGKPAEAGNASRVGQRDAADGVKPDSSAEPKKGGRQERGGKETDGAPDEESLGRREGLGYAITGGVLVIVSVVMLIFLITSFMGEAELVASLDPNRGFLGISVIVAIIVTIISAVGCIMASLASLYISSLALTRSEGIFRYIAIAEMSLSGLFIIASVALSIASVAIA